MSNRRSPRRLTAAALTTAAALIVLIAPAVPASAAPAGVQMPFPCAETWYAHSYNGHTPSAYAVDWNLLGSDYGRSVRAGVAGTAAVIANNGGYGNMVEVNAGDGWTYRYAHLSAFSVSTGQQVSPQTEIGKVGDSGAPGASHLHYEQRYNGQVQPVSFGGVTISYTPNFPGYPYTSANCGDPDVNGDGRADLVIVATGPTSSGKLEAHVLNGATAYSTWLGNWVTAAGYGNASTRYVMGDVNADGKAELVFVATGPTGSGKLEVHALNGATAYSTWLGNWATAAGYGNSADRYVMGDVNGDGRADLAVVATGPTGSGKLEVHVLDGATSFSTWLGNWVTPAGYGNASNEYVMGDVNGDGRADLVIVAAGPTGSGKLEAHVLNGATGFSTWVGNWATAAGYGNASTRYVMGDINADGKAELVFVATGPTGSGKLEVHALNGATAYSTWLGNWATAAGYGNSADRYVM